MEESGRRKPLAALSEGDFEVLTHCGYRHASYVKIPIEDKQFTPLFYFDVEMSKDTLKDIAEKLFSSNESGHVIRIKGFVKAGPEMQLVVNATEKSFSLTPSSSSRNVLIIIGEQLNKDYINNILKNFCSVVSL